MLCGIISSSNQKVIARQVTKNHGPFHCTGCAHELIVKKGNIKVHHFAHKPPYCCSRGEGESEAHRKCKETIYFDLMTQGNVTELDIEKDFGAVVADIYCKIDGVPVAIEVQRSNLSVNQITQRTSVYFKLGINVLWLALFDKKLNDDKYSPTAWMKWCHAAYFGRVFYWIEGLAVLPVHYGTYSLDVESTSWFDSDGNESSGGGYSKASKRYKTPSFGAKHNLVQDLQSAYRQPWSGGSVSIPQCRLYVSKHPKWW